MAIMYTFLWPMVRVSACLIAAPIFSAMSVNVTTRIGMAALFTILIFPLYDWPIIDVMSGFGLLVLLEQVVVGVMMGLILQIAFAAISAAGEFISLSMGLGFAMMADPNSGVQTPVVSQFLIIMATLIFISVGGHLIFIELLLDSFRYWPIDKPILTVQHIWGLMEWSILVFVGAAMIALPAMMVLLLSNAAMGVISRAAPSLNVFAVGFPMTLLLGLVLIMALLPTFFSTVEGIWYETFLQIRRLLGTA